MDPDSLWQMIVLLLCLILSGFFSSSETALMSINKIKMRQSVDAGVPGAALVWHMLEEPERWLSTILVGNNVVNIAASAVATALAINLFGKAGVGIATGVMTLLILIFAEITPKSMAATRAEKLALRIARPVYFLSNVLKPIVFALTAITHLIMRMTGSYGLIKEPQVTEEELRTMMAVSHEEGVLEGKEKRLLENVFEFCDAQVREAMIARTDITAIPVEASYEDVAEAFRSRRCSRIPVFEESMDNMIGIIHIKDFFLYQKRRDSFHVRDLMRKPFYTIESKRIADLFEEMRGRRLQMAIVVDEYGGTAGIITIQDLIEVIFGEIDDEYDISEEKIKKKINPNTYWVDGSMKLKDINELLPVKLESEDFETIGGLMTGELGRLPMKGDTLTLGSLRCVVREADRNRVICVSLTYHPRPQDHSKHKHSAKIIQPASR